MLPNDNCSSLWDEATTMLVVALYWWFRLLGLQRGILVRSQDSFRTSLWVSDWNWMTGLFL